jgi:hypothetical protein
MTSESHLSKIILFIDNLKKKYGVSYFFVVLLILLFSIILISFVFPLVEFGRLFGTDDYSHLFHTSEMAKTTTLSGFYDNLGGKVSDPSTESNVYNYPFGLWLFGATIVKITGLPPLSAVILFVMLFLFVIIGSFYIYSGLFLDSKEQKIVAILFLISMPNFALSILAYRPSIFVMPFLFLALYITFKEPIDWKLLLVLWLLLFIIILCHTGTFMFIITFSLTFFILNCLIWGKFSRTVYILVFSSFVIYVFSLRWFPEISNQYETKTGLFLSATDFFAAKLHFNLAADIGNVFYRNFLVEQQLIFAIFFGAFLFFMGKLCVYLHYKIAERMPAGKKLFPIALPITNISHSAVSLPIMIGPAQSLFSLLGVFRLDSKGKVIFISTIIIAVLPDFIQTSQGNVVATGAIREISFLVIIIPITAVLGLWSVLPYIDQIKNSIRPDIIKPHIISAFWVLLLCMFILIPSVATTYYLPKIAGEDYIINGMKWLGSNGDSQAAVVGYGYRTTPIYTNMSDATYGLQSGSETRTFLRLLKNVYFTVNEGDVTNLQHYFGVKYILTSDKLAANLKGTLSNLTIDNNHALNKIYSSQDFGVYEVKSTSPQQEISRILADNITLQNPGSSYQILSEDYMSILNAEHPSLERFGTPGNNYLGMGFITDNVRIYGMGENSTVDQFSLSEVPFEGKIDGNRIIYSGILKNDNSKINEASVQVIYTFYPKVIRREFLISNDWISSSDSQQMNVGFSTLMFIPMADFVIKNGQFRQARHIYPSDDGITKNNVMEEIYIFDQTKQLNIKFGKTAPLPTSMSYKGSTIYNMSSIGFSQTGSLKPGATLHITQYFSRGSEITSEKKINSVGGISLMNYPDGIVPIIISGYRTPVSDYGNMDNINNAYTLLKDEQIPYTEIINPLRITENPSIQNITSEESSTKIKAPNTTVSPVIMIDVSSLMNNNIKVIGSESTGLKYYNDISIQDTSITDVLNYGKDAGVSIIGFMPTSLSYNLDTLKIVIDKNLPMMLSNSVNPPYLGFFEEGYRNPEFAYYQGRPTNVLLLPISNPISTVFLSQPDTKEIFSNWKLTLNEVAKDDELAFFILRSADIGNPAYSEDFKDLFSYARDRGLTFTSPDNVTNYMRLLKNIQYSGNIDGDTASIDVINNNQEMVKQVTFRVNVPPLKNGNYSVNEGKIIRTKEEIENQVIYVSVDLPASSSKKIIISPENKREQMVVKIYERLLEDTISITVKDENGEPLSTSDVIIDSNYYPLDKEGTVQVLLRRGLHTIHIQNPGYNTFDYTIDVKGRLALAADSLKNKLTIFK